MENNSVFSLDIAKSLVDSTDQFPVDFDLAWRWLDYSRKDNAKTSFLKCGFIEKVDYLIVKESDNHAGLSTQEKASLTRKENFNLTIDCFKTWAMMSNTDKGKEVRLYFLECEKIAKEKYVRPMSPDEAIIQGLQLWRKQQEEILAIQQEQARQSEALIQQAVEVAVNRALSEKAINLSEENSKAIAKLSAEVEALRIMLKEPIPTCKQTLRQKLVEATQLLGEVFVQKGIACSFTEGIKQVWKRLLLKIKHSSARRDLSLLKSNLLKKYESDLKEWEKKGKPKGEKPKKKDYDLTYAAWIEKLEIEEEAYECLMSVAQDVI